MKRWHVIVLALMAAMAYGVWHDHRIAAEQNAYTCALDSERTDQAIAECFTNRGLRVPEDI